MGQKLTIQKYEPLTIVERPSEPPAMSGQLTPLGFDSAEDRQKIADNRRDFAIPENMRLKIPLDKIVGQPTVTMFQTALDDIGEMGRHPLKTAASIATMPYHVMTSHMREAQSAYDAFQRGDRGEGTVRALASIIPIVGPLFAEGTDETLAGRGPEWLGHQLSGLVFGKGAAEFGPAMDAARVQSTRTMTPARPVPVVEPRTLAARAGARSGIEPRAGAVIGGGVGDLLTVLDQGANKTTITGAYVGGKQQAARVSGLREQGNRLVQGARSKAQAGRGVTQELRNVSSDLARQATDEYNALQALQDAATPDTVVTGAPTIEVVRGPRGDVVGQRTVPAPSVEVPFAVDISEFVNDPKIKALYEKEMELGKSAPRMGAEKTMLDALSSLVRSRDVVSLMDADKILSRLKKIQRKSADLFGDDKTNINASVDRMSQLVDQRARQAGPDAVAALEEGRRLTTKKYEALEVLDEIQDKEPVAIVNRIRAMDDGGIEFLRGIDQHAPRAVPQIGMAILRDVVESLTDPAKRNVSLSAWQKLGDETKQILYRDQLKQDAGFLGNVETLLELGKEINADANPSKSAFAGGAMLHVGSTLSGGWDGFVKGLMLEGAAGASAVLNSPKVVRMIVKYIDAKNSPATQSFLRKAITAEVRKISTPATGMAVTGSMEKSKYVVMDQNGKPWYFKTQELADAAKKAAGIR